MSTVQSGLTQIQKRKMYEAEVASVLANIGTVEEMKAMEEEITSRFLNTLERYKERADKGEKIYFHFNDLRKDPLIYKYFPTIATIGERNIGKTTDLKKECELENAKGREWLWYRLTVDEVDEFVRSESKPSGWFTKNNWYYKQSDGAVYESKVVYDADKKPHIKLGKVVGHVRAFSKRKGTKSVDFPNVYMINCDEFAASSVSGIVDKFVHMITTIQRQKPEMRIYLGSNYDDEENPLLTALGMDIMSGSSKLINFDWLTGTIIVNIPTGVYYSYKTMENLGYRHALKSYKTWEAQYSSGYKKKDKSNLASMSLVHKLDHQFDFTYLDIEFRIGIANDGDYILAQSGHESEDDQVVTLNSDDYIKSPRHILVKPEKLYGILQYWRENRFRCDSFELRMLLQNLFSKIVKTR